MHGSKNKKISGKEKRPMDLETERLERLFKALGSKKRLLILQGLIENQEMHVGEIAEKLNSSIKAVSRNLQILSGAGFLSSRNTRNFVNYSIRSDGLHPDNLLALTVVKRNSKPQTGRDKAAKVANLISAMTIDPYLGKMLSAVDELLE